jgi:hypothetical protein
MLLAAAILRRRLLSSVDYDSGIVFSGLYATPGERITTHEFQTKSHGVLALTLVHCHPRQQQQQRPPQLRADCSFTHLPNPSTIAHLSVPSPFTRESYLAAPASAPPTSRVPSLPPHRFPHTLYLLSRSRCCERCELQQLACEIWWGSRGAILCAPQVPAAACTLEMRAIYYALGLPLGPLERACVD